MGQTEFARRIAGHDRLDRALCAELAALAALTLGIGLGFGLTFQDPAAGCVAGGAAFVLLLLKGPLRRPRQALRAYRRTKSRRWLWSAQTGVFLGGGYYTE